MATIKDVALACGVSQATVSQVLNNGRRPVHQATRERVLQTARALDYRPNAVARGLARKRMNTLGIVFQHGDSPASGNPFLMMVLDGVCAVSIRRRQSIMLYTVPDWNAAECPPELSDGRCDGVLLLVPSAHCTWLATLAQRKVPFVLVGGRDPSGQTASVKVDDIAAAREMTEYLLGLGHQRIAFVSHPSDQDFPFVQDRAQGYRQAIAATGQEALSFTQDEALSLIPSAPDRPTALFCSHDIVALYLQTHLQARGVRIPEDVSLVGFDDIPDAGSGVPALTTIRQPMAQMGESATETLLAIIEERPFAESLAPLPTELVIRQSAAPFSSAV